MRVAVVALLVVLAGCPSFGSQGIPTPTPDVEPRTEGVPYPPGLGPAGVEDPAALARAHSASVNSTAYTIDSTRRITGPKGRLRSLLAVTVRLSADREYYATVRTAGPDAPELLGRPPARAAYWSNGTVYVRALTRDGETSYNRFVPPDSFAGTWRYWRSTAAFGGTAGHDDETFTRAFSDVRTVLTGTTIENDIRLWHVEGGAAVRPDFAKVGSGPVSNVTLEATVTQAGIVRRFDLRYDRRVEGEPVTVTWTLAHGDVGSTTVERPPWFDRALEGPGAAFQDDASP